ncbi:hypothetical protein HanRHA438_Chr03g0127681 [Helianthus annuus]|nr:hypothetical protein HanHA300_Chr03g0096771 [Helianthus annuus]KAJ0601292.1 hypothetical protein HanIR_Chr03g0126691 [Helianthus annuus]KAJ0608431.1 hypothetical protein HanHA89_Chr03g0108461 [Helianthus annuus]KAJ0768494.1 hypothetical protein HanLR1_Chr03g0101821 [Helianthus annuus]KAJ0936162.1 hypothetical protein HanRHA438_Chr03g0127681 [Helianthus annuus]
MNPSLQNLFHFFFMFFTLFTSKAFSLPTQLPISYSDHCNSYVPEAIPTDNMFTRFSELEPVNTHYSGGQGILDQDPSSPCPWSINFQTNGYLFRTNVVDTYRIQARLRFYGSYIHDPTSKFTKIIRGHHQSLEFYLDGFWSVSTSKLCMVGSTRFTKQGNPLTLNAVLKLKFARFINMKNSLVSGILESLASPNDFDYFDPISILAFPRVDPLNYNYTLVSNVTISKTNFVQDSVTRIKYLDICSIFTQRFITHKLEYPSNCKNCSLFGEDHGKLPAFMSLYGIQCSREDNKIRVLVEFQDRRFAPYGQSFRPDISLIGEGTWNGRKYELSIVACHILNQSDPLSSAHVGDCSIVLTLWFPVVRSITKTHITEGQIWTTKLTDDLGSFRMAKFQSFDHSQENYAVKYEYTQMEKVRQICPKKKRLDEKYLGDHQLGCYEFRMSVKHKNMVSRGFAVPIIVDISTTAYNGPVNVSYEVIFMLNISSIGRSGISSLNLSSTDDNKVEISAEGVYDDKTGQLCMVGCRNLKNASFDCEILVKFQFPRGKESFIKGNIESLREKNDALYFENLNIISQIFDETEARESIWRMDLEIMMVLISDTLICVFTRRQVLHLKKRAEMVNFISVSTMLILTLGHMVPLVLNVEAIFSNTSNQRKVPIRSDGLLEANEVIVRLVTIVAFILQFHLLQLTWIAKKNRWIHEIRTLCICLPMYIIGGSTMFLLNWKNNNGTISSQSQRSIWVDLRSYAGLTIDGFLFPQLILNIFQASKENALSHSFYIGTTFVRLLPHAYDLYRGQKYISHQLDRLYIYANPRSNFYSPSWDIVILCGGLLFAVIVFLQQRVGGRFMFPKRFQGNVEYEVMPVTSSN